LERSLSRASWVWWQQASQAIEAKQAQTKIGIGNVEKSATIIDKLNSTILATDDCAPFVPGMSSFI